MQLSTVSSVLVAQVATVLIQYMAGSMHGQAGGMAAARIAPPPHPHLLDLKVPSTWVQVTQYTLERGVLP